MRRTAIPLRPSGIAWAVILVAACSDGTAPDGGEALPGNNALVFRDGGELDDIRPDIRTLVDSGVRAARTDLPVTGVTLSIGAGKRYAIPEIGLGGYAPESHLLYIDIDTAMPGIADSVRQYLPLLVAHELHHTMRHRSEGGYGSTLAEAIVSEGLADRFAVEVSGRPPPPWSIALTDAQLDKWNAAAMAVWHEPGYDHAAWFVGAAPPIPRWTGYALGWDLVADYQSRNGGVRAGHLWDTPAADLLPE